MLTHEQIDLLYAFCRKKYVRYYDVQVELVDHLANAIEERMAAQPDLSFENALQDVYKGFGKTGFAPLLRQKEKAVAKFNSRLMWGFFKAQLRWPKILMVLLVWAITYTAVTQFDREIVRYLAIVIFTIATFIVAREIFSLRRMEKRSGQKFMLINLAGVVNLTYAPFNVLLFMKEFGYGVPAMSQPYSVPYALVISTFITLYVAVSIAVFHTVKHIRFALVKAYPHLFTIAG